MTSSALLQIRLWVATTNTVEVGASFVVCGNLWYVTLSKTQRENGNVMTTNNQDIQKSNQPRNPSPVFLLLWREPAETQLITITSASKLSEGEVKSPILRFYSQEK